MIPIVIGRTKKWVNYLCWALASDARQFFLLHHTKAYYVRLLISSSVLENSMAKIKTNGNQFCCYLKVPWEVKINFMIEFFVLATDFCGAFLCRNKLCFPSRQVSPTLTFVFLLIGKTITNRYVVSGIFFVLSHSMREIRKSSSWLLKKLNFKACL